MSHILIIRLPALETAPVDWLLWDSTTHHKSDSGTLPSWHALHELAEKQGDVPLIGLADSSAVTIHTLTVPGKLTRAVKQTLPYRLEDDVVDDVEEQHFVVLSHEDDQVRIAAVNNSQMEQWNTALNQAGLHCHRLLPEALCLPWQEGTIQVLQHKISRPNTIKTNGW